MKKFSNQPRFFKFSPDDLIRMFKNANLKETTNMTKYLVQRFQLSLDTYMGVSKNRGGPPNHPF